MIGEVDRDAGRIGRHRQVVETSYLGKRAQVDVVHAVGEAGDGVVPVVRREHEYVGVARACVRAVARDIGNRVLLRRVFLAYVFIRHVHFSSFRNQSTTRGHGDSRRPVHQGHPLARNGWRDKIRTFKNKTFPKIYYSCKTRVKRKFLGKEYLFHLGKMNFNRSHPKTTGTIPPPHLPVFAVIASSRECARISREEQRGDVLMNTGYPRKGEWKSAAHRGMPAPTPRQAIPLSSVGIDSPRSGLKYAKGCAMNFDKIVKNQVNIDKFTMFFDKILAGKKLIRYCY